MTAEFFINMSQIFIYKHIDEEFFGHLNYSGLKMKFINMESALKLIWPENADD